MSRRGSRWPTQGREALSASPSQSVVNGEGDGEMAGCEPQTRCSMGKNHITEPGGSLTLLEANPPGLASPIKIIHLAVGLADNQDGTRTQRLL